METVLVTGGRGRSGRWIVSRLTDQYNVVCIDLDHPGFEVESRENVDFRAADLTDRGQVTDLVAEFDPDAVVHWGAIPSPTRHSGGRVFENNALGAYNVLVAAGRAGAQVIQASSESAYGFPFAREPRLPDTLPITEDYALRPEDPYGTAKVVAEEVAEMVTRRYEVSIASIRPSWIQYPGEYHCRDSPAVGEDGAENLAAGVGNFWSYVDVRDVAGIVETALSADIDGHEPYHAVAADNYLDRPTTEAVEAFFGELPDSCTLTDDESALSTAKGKENLDWTPAHSWREAATETVAEPPLAEE